MKGGKTIKMNMSLGEYVFYALFHNGCDTSYGPEFSSLFAPFNAIINLFTLPKFLKKCRADYSAHEGGECPYHGELWARCVLVD